MTKTIWSCHNFAHWELSCHDMCEILTWMDNLIQNKSKQICTIIQLKALKSLYYWAAGQLRLCCVMLPRFWLFWTTFTILNSSEIELKQGRSTWITHVSSDAWNLWIKIPKYVYGFLPWYLLCCKLDTLHQPRRPSLNRTPACDWLLCVLTGYLV